MARDDGKAENQHIVPKMLLRSFAAPDRPKSPALHVFDKRDGRRFIANIDNVACERGFYEAELEPGLIVSMEQGLSKLEDETARALEKLRTERRLDALKEDEATCIAMFVAVQYLRSKTFREMKLDVDTQLAKWVTEQGGNPARVKGWKFLNGPEEAKRFQFGSISKFAPKLSLSLMRKHWLLFQTEPGRPFWISDNPVVMHNEVDRGFLGNIGFDVPGIQIYLPISSTLIVGIWCPAQAGMTLDAVRKANESLERLRQTIRESPAYRPGPVDEIVLGHICGEKMRQHTADAEAIRTGVPLSCNAQNVTFLNWLQVRWAERQILLGRCRFQPCIRHPGQGPAVQASPAHGVCAVESLDSDQG